MDFYRFRLPGFERPFGRIVRNQAFLVVISTKRKDEKFVQEEMEELTELAKACNMRVAGVMAAHVHQPSPSHYLRKGKLEQIKKEMEEAKANIMVCNIDLSPSQSGNIEKAIDVPMMDRTGLILEIFGRRAKSREGKLQVELAQLQYALPRIGGLGTVMSRLGGGIGSRGPGEQELERDRRKVRQRIDQIKKKTNQVAKHRKLIRDGRKKRSIKTVALVGYTNAGKSTLLNALTGSEAFVADQLFATLDPKARGDGLQGHKDLLFVDTVGFLKRLPHSLIKAFHATLEEVVESDLMAHVLDVSHTNFEEFKKSVELVLEEMGAGDKRMLLVLNKADLLNSNELQRIKATYPEGILISARKNQGLNHLLAKIQGALPS